MLKKFIFLCFCIAGTAYAMQGSSDDQLKLGNPWAQLPQLEELDPRVQSLFDAIQAQDVFSIHTMVTEQPHLLEARNKHGLTPIHYASNFHDVDVVRTLLACGASVQADSPLGTPLHLASSEGMVPIMELLLAHGANMHARDQWGRTSLYDAIYDLNYDATEFLLKRGAWQIAQEDGESNVLQDNMGRTPLHTAVIRLNEVEDYGNKCKANPLLAIADPDKYLIRYLVLKDEKRCLAKLIFSYQKTLADVKDRLGKTAYEYECLIKVLPLSKSKKEEVSRSFLPQNLTVRKSPVKTSPVRKSPNKSSNRQVQKIVPSKPTVQTEQIIQAVQQEPVTEQMPVVQEKAEAQERPLVVQELSPRSSLYAGYTPDRFAKRVIDWFENTSLATLLVAGSGWWRTLSVRKELQYHQIPFVIIDDVMRFGVQELRERTNRATGQDIKWRMHGCMQFDNGMHNPWYPGRTKQEGFFHCTKGRDGKIYHIGFDPIQEGAFLVSYFPKEYLQETITTKVYDKEKQVTYILYA